jgi:RNA polymerase sigma factor (sigma-70 family)
MQAEAAAIETQHLGRNPRVDQGFAIRTPDRTAAGSRVNRIIRLTEHGRIDFEKASSLLMDEFRKSANVDAYSALYDLNWRRFLGFIRKRLAGFRNRIGELDVLQEVFLLIYRYPTKFRNEHRNSFRNWSYSIILNSIRRKIGKAGMTTVDVQTIAETQTDCGTRTPLHRLIVSEDVERLKRLYSLALMLYMNAYRSRLNKMEKDALHLVEVLKVPYRDAADKLGIKYDNFKMMICRARRKIASAIAGYVKLASETEFASQSSSTA